MGHPSRPHQEAAARARAIQQPAGTRGARRVPGEAPTRAPPTTCAPSSASPAPGRPPLRGKPPLLPAPLRAPTPSSPAPGALAGGSGCRPPCPSGAVSARKGPRVHTRAAANRKPCLGARDGRRRLGRPSHAREGAAAASRCPPAPLRLRESAARAALLAALGAQCGRPLAGPPAALSPLVPPGGTWAGTPPSPHPGAASQRPDGSRASRSAWARLPTGDGPETFLLRALTRRGRGFTDQAS